MKIKLSAVVGLIVAAVSCLSLSSAEPEKAQAILAKVAATYAAVSSYQDSGVVLTTHPDGNPDEIIFETTFVRPDTLRFDWNRHHPYPPLRHIKTSRSIWPDGKGAHFMAMGEKEPTEVSLNQACSGAAGVSRGSSHHIPRLLTSTVTGFSIVELADARRVGEEVFEGVRCHRIEGIHPRGIVYHVWVGEADFLVRRIVREPGPAQSEEIHRQIRINGEIPAAKLVEKRQGIR